MADSPERIIHAVQRKIESGVGGVELLASGSGQNVLVYGPSLFDRDVMQIVHDLGLEDLTVYFSTNLSGAGFLLQDGNVGLFVYHASQRGVMPPNPTQFVQEHSGTKLPDVYEAVTLKYTGGSQPMLVAKLQREFEEGLGAKLKKLF